MEHLNIIFYLKKFRANKKGNSPVYARVTFNHKRFDSTTGLFVDPIKWDPKAEQIIGRKEEDRHMNNTINLLRSNIQQKFNLILASGQPITFEHIKNIIQGKEQEEDQHTLLSVIRFHNKQMEAQVGEHYAKGTYKHYKSLEKKVETFLKTQYKQDDIKLKDIKYQFITDFEFFDKTVNGCEHNTVMKRIKNIKKMIGIAVANDWIAKDPFASFKCTSKQTHRGYLTQEELQTIIDKDFGIRRLEVVRDIFIFSCYTGLAYSDVQKLTPADVTIGVDAKPWIIVNRIKTNTRCPIPLLPEALEIIEKYKDDKEASIKGVLLPILSNQRMNGYLKEIADLCKITKPLTFHVARHTFCTTITLSNGVPIETISKMVGHTSIRTTQIYSKIVDTKVSFDMGRLEEIMALKKQIASNGA